MRVVLNERLSELGGILGEMVSMAGSLMEQATQSLLQADLAVAETVITEYDKLAILSHRGEERAMSLLARQAPVATDLRSVISAIQIVADIERMGALALHVAQATRRRHPNHVLPEEVNGYFSEMGKIAVGLAAQAKEVLETRNTELAARLSEEDDAMDDLHNHLFTLMMDREWKHSAAEAVDVALLGRYYERFADHAVEVGRRVIFLVTGHLPIPTD
ncbi:phosphate signaling complex protein PhoU [Smaragdicoccus niigatensis]|uniref:phosphate signaling complex protein PhoU n=1 Tax=Smaragdicoccus niigatensis TaxID=359359 RepID=UPI00037D525F|nr:phosphate signaling complex protein PhoU [Smaragdicoccus niigatensis]